MEERQEESHTKVLFKLTTTHTGGTPNREGNGVVRLDQTFWPTCKLYDCMDWNLQCKMVVVLTSCCGIGVLQQDREAAQSWWANSGRKLSRGYSGSKTGTRLHHPAGQQPYEVLTLGGWIQMLNSFQVFIVPIVQIIFLSFHNYALLCFIL